MPCNSDYMMPSPEEIKRLGEKTGQLKSLADEMVYDADVMRELSITAQGSIDNLSVREGIDLAKRVAVVQSKIDQGNKLVESIKNEYAYRNLGNSNPKSAIAGYEKVRNLYQAAHVVANKLVSGEVISQTEMDAIEVQQTEHRIEDVKRLIKVFADRGDFRMVGELAKIDFTQELTAQLGFDPDSI